MLVLLILSLSIRFASEEQTKQDERKQEALANSGYNWTKNNYTIFEMYPTDSFFESSTIAELQCGNGIEEACEYLRIQNDDYSNPNFFIESILNLGLVSCCLLPFCIILIVVQIGRKLESVEEIQLRKHK